MNESQEERDQRLEKQRLRQTAIRRSENEEATQMRRSIDKQRYILMLNSIINSNFNNKTLRQRHIRSNETKEETVERLAEQRLRQAILRANETQEETQNRRFADAQR